MNQSAVPTPDDVMHGQVGARPERSFGNALKWSYVMDGGKQAATTVITFVLAGVLGPAAFGTVAMAAVYVLFVQMMMQQGMIPAIIQRRTLKPAHLDSAFWMVMGTSAILTAVSVALSGWWASVNRLPDLRPVIVVLSLLIPLKALVVVQEGVLRREMDFRTLALRTNASVILGGVVGVVMAIKGFGVWALVAQQLVTGVVELLIIWSASEWRPRWLFSLRCAKELLGFSAASSFASIGVFLNIRSDALLVGLLFGPAAVGLYRFAARMVDMLIDTTVRSLQAVSLPEFSRLQDQQADFSARLLELLRLSSILALPALGVLSASSGSLMAVVGSQWTTASTPLKLLCLVGAVRALTFFNGPMLQAVGRPQYVAALVWGAAILSSTAFILAGLLFRDASTGTQLLGISASRMVLYLGVFFTVNIGILLRIGHLSLPDLLRAVSPAAAAAVAAVIAGEGLQLLPISGDWSPLVLLLTTVLSGAASAVGMLALTDRRYRGLALTCWRGITARLRPGRTLPEMTTSLKPASLATQSVLGSSRDNGDGARASGVEEGGMTKVQMPGTQSRGGIEGAA